MNVDLVEPKINDKTKALLPVHFTGYMTDMRKIMPLAKNIIFQLLKMLVVNFR